MRRIKLVVAVGVVMAALLALTAGSAMAEIEFDDGGDLSFSSGGVFLDLDSDDDIFDDDDDDDIDDDIDDDDDDDDNDVDIDLD